MQSETETIESKRQYRITDERITHKIRNGSGESLNVNWANRKCSSAAKSILQQTLENRFPKEVVPSKNRRSSINTRWIYSALGQLLVRLFLIVFRCRRRIYDFPALFLSCHQKDSRFLKCNKRNKFHGKSQMRHRQSKKLTCQLRRIPPRSSYTSYASHSCSHSNRIYLANKRGEQP